MAQSQVQGSIRKVSGPLVVADGMREARMFDVVRVGDKKLIGEIIEMQGRPRLHPGLRGDRRPRSRRAGRVATGEPLSVELGPGPDRAIFDGIQRPLEQIRKLVGDHITRGVHVPGLDRERKWDFVPTAKAGDAVTGGDILGDRPGDDARPAQDHGAPGTAGTIKRICERHVHRRGRHRRTRRRRDRSRSSTLMQRWPVRRARPYERAAVARGAAGHRAARHRHVLPDRQGRHGLRARAVRQRQDGHPAPARQVGRRRHRRLRRLRRARQRDDRRAHGVPRAEGPAHRASR